MPRLFVAIDLPEAHKTRLAALRDDALKARWTAPGQFHLTLRFLGEMDEESLPGLEAALTQVREPAFSLQGRGLGVFPSLRRPGVLFAAIDPAPTLETLQARVEAAVRALGVEAEQKPFHPHVTLARLKGESFRKVRAFLQAHRAFVLDPFDVAQFHLYASILRPEGSLHRRLRSFTLDA